MYSLSCHSTHSKSRSPNLFPRAEVPVRILQDGVHAVCRMVGSSQFPLDCFATVYHLFRSDGEGAPGMQAGGRPEAGREPVHGSDDGR